MAALTRRTWLNLRDDLMQRVGRGSVTAYEARAQELLAAAYFEICTLFHHYELDEEDASLTLSTTSNQLALPADTFGIFSFSVRHPGTGAWIATLTWEEAHSLLNRYQAVTKAPSEGLDRYTRYGSNLELPRLPDQAYKTTLRYYKVPAAPDFSSGSPAIGRWWDQVILDYAEQMAWGTLWRPDLAQGVASRIQIYLENTPQPYLKDIPLFGAPESPTRATPHGGAQG
jgi:hypothetical protein